MIHMASIVPSLIALATSMTLALVGAPPVGQQPTDGAKPGKAAASAAKPNFVFIQAEAQGWSSTSVDMDGEPPSTARPAGLTPNLEAFAKEGTRFSDFYVTCPRCTPSRTSFVTGISPAKLHMTYQAEGGRKTEDGESPYKLMRMIPPTADVDLPAGVKTTGGLLGDLGYASAHFGKWHVGRKSPTQLGFTLCDGANSNQGPERGTAPNPKQAVEITDRGIAFMHEQVKAGTPFYLQISHYGFGSEEEATPESLATAKGLVPGVSGKPMGAIAGANLVDAQVGRVLTAIAELGIADRTFVFYSADHGAQGGGGGGGRQQANPPFSGAKGSVSEGGIRVPLIVRGPGVKAGAISHVRACGMDLVPTMLDLAGSPVKQPTALSSVPAIEGGTLVPAFKGGTDAVQRAFPDLVIHFPHYDLNNGGPATAIYRDQWKLVRNDDAGTIKLYDIAKDRAESNDLAAANAELVAALVKQMDSYLEAVHAQRAVKNTDPAAGTGKAPERRGGQGGGQGGGGGGGKGGQGGGKGNKQGGQGGGQGGGKSKQDGGTQ
jgi:arylsulfatase A-like enzyme